MRASQPVPDREPSQPPPQQSHGGRTTKDKPQPPQASSQHWKREWRTQANGQENIRDLDQLTGRVRSLRTQGRDEPRRAAETAVEAHKRLRHLRPEAYPPEGKGRAAGWPHLQTKQTSPQQEHPDTGCKTPTTPASKRSRRSPEKKGRAEAQPTSPGKQKDRHPVTWKPQGNLQQGKQRTLQALRKSTAHGRNPSGAAKNPPTQPQEETSKLESDMLTLPARAQNPEGEAAEGGAALAQGRNPSGVTGHLYQDTPNPH